MNKAKIEEEILTATMAEFSRYKKLGDETLAQLSDAEIWWRPNSESNSIGVIVKHVSGNLRSRWTDFLTSDGEKTDRERDREFDEIQITRSLLMERWEGGWHCLYDTLQSLKPDDLMKTVTIRGHACSVVFALQRALAHLAYHVGQIVLQAKQQKGGDFKSLSIPRGQSQGSRAK